MRELIEGWGDRVEFARHCREHATLIDPADFFSVEELVAANYSLQQILHCSFELQEVTKSFPANDICYKHLRGIPSAVYLSVSQLKHFYTFHELSLCFPLEDLIRNFDLAVIIDGIKFGAYSATNIDAVGRSLGVDWTIRYLKWNGLTLGHIPKDSLEHWNLSRLHPTFSMNDLLVQYGMVEITKAFSPGQLEGFFSLRDLMAHFSCCELVKHFRFKPNTRTILLECVKRDLALVHAHPMTSIGEHVIRDDVPLVELIQFVRHRKEFDRIGLELNDLRKMGLSCKGAVHLGYRIDSLRDAGYTCEDIRQGGLDHIFAAHAGFSFFEIQDAMELTAVDRSEIEDIMIWGTH
jgi:hypothetical protein